MVNAANLAKDWAHLEGLASRFDVRLKDESDEIGLIALQGPRAQEILAPLSSEPLDPIGFYEFAAGTVAGVPGVISRTGYTGEDGFELALSGEQAEAAWNALAAAGVRPCGLGARDTLRLEAGMNLYGQDMDETVTPLESGLAWTVAMKDDRPFIGREVLEAQRAAGVSRRLTGLVLEERGVLRHGQVVVTDAGEGSVTSGSWSPTLERAIALARVPAVCGDEVAVDIRGKRLAARFVRPPFARNGAVCDGIL